MELRVYGQSSQWQLQGRLEVFHLRHLAVEPDGAAFRVLLTPSDWQVHDVTMRLAASQEDGEGRWEMM